MPNHIVGSRFTLWAVLGLCIYPQIAFGELPFDLVKGGRLRSSQISPEATKPLPAQPEDRGALMPLHAASVLSWLCGDATVQSRLGKSKSDCYAEIWPMVSVCSSELQEKAPAAQNRKIGERMDIVSFRAAFRQCLAQKYTEQQQAKGLIATSIADGEPDPLASRMNTKVTP